MFVSLKDSLKLIGIMIICFCAVFVCTFFLNFYLDAKTLEGTFDDPELISLYSAQMSTAKFTCAISGGCLAIIAVVMLAFYIKLYIDKNAKNLGIMKAMGYSVLEIAIRFSVFGFSIFFGAALGFVLGFIFMPTVYKSMSISGLPEINITFHPSLLFLLVFLPSIVFSLLSIFYAYLALRRPVSEMLKGKAEKFKTVKHKEREKERSFIKEMCVKTIFGKKSLAFFVFFACFCFSAMVQMAVSMKELSAETMGGIILVIGLVLAVTTIIMALTSLVNGNMKNISIMKAFGYSMKECTVAVLVGYHLFAIVGFGIGTIYQYMLLSFAVNIIFKDVTIVPDYNFNWPVFFITFACFIVFYEVIMIFYSFKINKISVKEVMTEE